VFKRGITSDYEASFDQSLAVKAESFINRIETAFSASICFGIIAARTVVN
jgi:hypothetical protein